jgi:hypothetical protein
MKPATAVRLAKIRRGIIGFLGILALKRTNPATPTTPKLIGTTTFADLHGFRWPPVLIPYSSETMDRVKMAIPIHFKPFIACIKDASGFSSLRNAKMPAAAITQMGIVIRNTLRDFCQACKSLKNILYVQLTISKIHSVRWRHLEQALRVNPGIGSRKTTLSPCLNRATSPYQSK